MPLDPTLETDILRWLHDDVDDSSREELSALLNAARTAPDGAEAEELRSAFAAPLTFGTAGLRGAMGPGPGRMNRAVVTRAAYGLSRVLHECAGKGFRVVIGYDARFHSDEFAHDTAAVVTALGGEALLMPHPTPTPVLAYALRALHADAGVMVTASHNPARDNGYKVYLGGSMVPDDERGVQIVAPWDARIYEEIRQAPPAREVPRADEGWTLLPASVVDDYAEQVSAGIAQGMFTAQEDLPTRRTLRLVTTAMHGVGGALLDRVLRDAGFADVHPVAEQQDPDPVFPTVPFPNPEEAGALDLALAQARALGADLVLANDPDADRCSAAIPDVSAPGGWRQLSGDEIGSLLGDFLAARHEGASAAVLANSVVSSRLLGKIADSYGVGHATTLTGFKWIARTPGMVFGYEEAIGFCVLPQVVRDKDGISTCLLLACYAAFLRASGSSLAQRLDELALAHGVYATAPLTIRVDDLSRIGQMMSLLRERGVPSLASSPVSTVVDLTDGWGHLPPTDGLLFLSEDSDRVIVRPSGTEPKLKCYCEVVVPVEGADLASARAAAAARMGEVIADMRRALGVESA